MSQPAHYQRVRHLDGHRRRDAAYYRRLPWTVPGDPQTGEWEIRRRSYARLLRHVLAVDARGRRILDLGAGAGWLSHRLAVLGHRPYAIDLSADAEDGLGACRHYDVRFPCLQADFHHLPVATGGMDVVVFNASLHYADDVLLALREADRVLRPGGTLAVLDSPCFAADEDGEAMVHDQQARFRALGVPHPARWGIGYLTYGGLAEAARHLGRTWSFMPTHGPWHWELRRLLARPRLGRRPARFGVWVAR